MRVAFDPESKEYLQLRAVRSGDEYWTIQVYDNELVYMKGVWSGCKYKDETLDWMRTNFDIESGLTAEVYRSGLGDCTNGGISAHRRDLYILGKTKLVIVMDTVPVYEIVQKRFCISFRDAALRLNNISMLQHSIFV